jgi:S-adenosylhomocysteine hydrolase
VEDIDLLDLDFFKKNIPLHNCVLICCQHIVSTTEDMFNFLFEKGLSPKNTYILGKCYSTNPITYQSLIHQDVNVSKESLSYSSYESYDSQFSRSIDLFINEILEKIPLQSFEKVIIMDDGGKLIDAVRKHPKFNKAKIFAIEQTSSGYNSLKEENLEFPIINVARAKTKLVHETELLKELINEIFEKNMKGLLNQKLRVLILGNGVIGKMCASILQTRSSTQISDIYQIKDEDETEFHNYLKNNLSEFDLIVGCTGYISLPHKLHKYLKKSVKLISFSSSDREFDAVHFRKMLPINTNCHADLLSENFQLYNSGFPIPFNGDYDHIDKKEFILTRSILTAAIFQIFIHNLEPGFNPLEEEYDKKLFDYWGGHLNKSLSLIHTL